MLDAQSGTIFGSVLGGGIMLLAQAASAIDPLTQWLANLGGLGVLIWMVLRQDAIRKQDRDLCDREIGYLRQQVQTLWRMWHGEDDDKREATEEKE